MTGVPASYDRYRKGERVALFLPCYCDAFYPQVGQAALALFQRLGIPLEYPIEQTCCGQPAFNAGRWAEARSVAARFAQVFDAYRWIVVPSGSCGAMARSFYAMLGEPSAAAAGTKVFDLATFLVHVAERVDVGARFQARVTYHDGCHARRELHASDAALALLRAVKDLEYVELPRMEECCGFGGLFSVKYSTLSISMGEAKCRCIESTSAAFVTSSDSSCLMHIEGLMRASRPKSPVRFLNLVQILASDG